MQVIGPFFLWDKAKELEAEKEQSGKYAVVCTRPNPNKKEGGYVVVCQENPQWKNFPYSNRPCRK